jgi:hypothetical protein
VLTGEDVSVSVAFRGAGSVLSSRILGGGLADVSINTIAGNNLIEANATLQQIHASNQLAMVKAAQAKAAADAKGATEQGRDALGKFLPKQPGQTAPGAAAEKQGLDS